MWSMTAIYAIDSSLITDFSRRWTFYVLIIWTAAILVLIYFCVPETYHPV
jgi:uncharacterized membrane protein YdfJ with MMPL/SSD domain